MPTNREFIQALIAEGLNSYSGSPYLRIRRNITLDLIADRAEKLGLTVRFHEHKVYELTGRGKSVVFHQNAPENSVVSTSITPDKSLTKRFLGQRQLPVPQGRIFSDYNEALEYFSACTVPQVVKPNSGARSRGVSANVVTTAQFEKAWAAAFQATHGRVIVEDYITGDYLRVLVIGGKAVAAYVCVPAYVIGNGIDSVGEIIRQKNHLRRQNPSTMSQRNSIYRADLLETSGHTLDSVPASGQWVALTDVANIGAGGESLEVGDRVHPSLLRLGEQCVQAIPGLHVAGVDMIVKDFLAPAQPQNAVILELNSNPAFDDHVFPMYGKPVDIPGLMLDFVLRDERIGRKIEPNDGPVYQPSCGGAAFSRSYDVQMEVIQQAGHRNNLQVETISNLIFALSSEKQRLAFREGMSDRTTSVSRMASNRKDWTKRLLTSWGITTPQGESFTTEQRDQAWHFAEKLARPVVVKPRSGSGGRGVTVNISTREHFELAWEVACKGDVSTIVTEEFFSANDYRLFVVGDRVRAAAQRVPAYVIGDGRRTVQELIDVKNRLRRDNPYLGAKLIKITPMIEFNLQQQGMRADTVLNSGQHLRLHSVANIGSGGESRDVSDIMHAAFTEIAIKARMAIFNAPYVGVDLLAEDIARSPYEQRWMVIEVNANPDVALHHFPSVGTPRDAAGALVEHLFPECAGASIAQKSVQVLLTGKVQGVGYRDWIWRHAHLHALSGWVRNRDDGSVEAVFCGAPHAVDHMAVLCKSGPRRAVVDDCRVVPLETSGVRGFVVKDATAVVTLGVTQ